MLEPLRFYCSIFSHNVYMHLYFCFFFFQGRGCRKTDVPKYHYSNNQSGISISVPAGYPFPFTAQVAEPPRPPTKCGVTGCNNDKKYSCSKTGIPLCSLQCYKSNLSKHHLTLQSVTTWHSLAIRCITVINHSRMISESCITGAQAIVLEKCSVRIKLFLFVYENIYTLYHVKWILWIEGGVFGDDSGIFFLFSS